MLNISFMKDILGKTLHKHMTKDRQQLFRKRFSPQALDFTKLVSA